MDKNTFQRIWEKGIILLDTSTLDYISRCEFETAKKIMDIFLLRSNSVFIPYHVSLEMKPFFDKNITHKYVDEYIHELTRDVSKIIEDGRIDEKEKKEKIISKIHKTINKLEKYSFGIPAMQLRPYLKVKNINDIDFSEILGNPELRVNSVYKDTTVKRFLQMIMNNTLRGLTEKEKEEIRQDAEIRNHLNKPPGSGDSNKNFNSDGDVIIWHEILNAIKEKRSKYLLFITQDCKKGNNWFNKCMQIHESLNSEVRDIFGYEAVSITEIKEFLECCKPFVDKDINNLIMNLDKMIDFEMEVEKYFDAEGFDKLMEEITDEIRDKYAADCAIPEDLQLSLCDFEFDCQEDDVLVVTFGFQGEGCAEANYHFDREDWKFDADYQIYGEVTTEISIFVGEYSKVRMLDLDNINYKVDIESVVGSDPLGRDDDEDYQEE